VEWYRQPTGAGLASHFCPLGSQHCYLARTIFAYTQFAQEPGLDGGGMHVGRADGQTQRSLRGKMAAGTHLARHNVSYRASKDLAWRAYWGQCRRQEFPDVSILGTDLRTLVPRSPASTLVLLASDQSKPATQRIRRGTWTLFMLAALWAALRDLASVPCFRGRHAYDDSQRTCGRSSQGSTDSGCHCMRT
jgi:hypothetical protein